MRWPFVVTWGLWYPPTLHRWRYAGRPSWRHGSFTLGRLKVVW